MYNYISRQGNIVFVFATIRSHWISIACCVSAAKNMSKVRSWSKTTPSPPPIPYLFCKPKIGNSKSHCMDVQRYKLSEQIEATINLSCKVHNRSTIPGGSASSLPRSSFLSKIFFILQTVFPNTQHTSPTLRN